MADVVVVGSLNMDLVVRTARLPAPGETVRGEGLQMIPGGKGANQAVAAAKLGCDVAMVGRVGNDGFGSRLVETLEQFGVDISHLDRDGGSPTGTALITVSKDGMNTIVISSGANGHVGSQDIRRAEDLILGAKVLLLQFEIPIETVQQTLELTAGRDIQVILNPAPARDLDSRYLECVDILVPNEIEARSLVGLEITDWDSASRAALELLGMGPHAVVLTLGSHGALMATADGIEHFDARQTTAVDTTAAGDAFVGGLAAALTRGDSLPDAVRYANCVGALTVTKFGAQTSLPTAAEVRAFCNRDR
jgi:ribokinase